jgi:hypothetical protein
MCGHRCSESKASYPPSKVEPGILHQPSGRPISGDRPAVCVRHANQPANYTTAGLPAQFSPPTRQKGHRGSPCAYTQNNEQVDPKTRTVSLQLPTRRALAFHLNLLIRNASCARTHVNQASSRTWSKRRPETDNDEIESTSSENSTKRSLQQVDLIAYPRTFDFLWRKDLFRG